MANPRFSVVVPCYNAAATVAQTIASVQAQTCPDLEIIAVDNNSRDATAEILAGIARGEPRLRIICQPVQGLSAARNAGILAALGRFVALLDADDMFDPDYLARHAENLADGSVGISYSRIRLVDAAAQPTGNVTKPPLSGLGAVDLLRSNPCTAMIVVRREVFDRAGLFDERQRRMEDQEWMFRAAYAGFVFRGIDRALASYRTSPGGLSMDLEAMIAAHGQMLEAAEAIAPRLVQRHRRMSRAAMLRYCARRALDHGDHGRAARGYLGRMLRCAPDIVLREPLPTLKTVAAVALPGLIEAVRGTRSRRLSAKEA